MRLTLVVPTALAAKFAEMAASPLEVGGVLLARLVESGGQLRLLGRRIEPVAAEHYELQASDELIVRSEGYVRALRVAEERGEVALWVHTHPGQDAMPVPSRHDLEVDREIAETFRIRTGQAYYGALILSPSANGFRFSGHLTDGRSSYSIQRAWVVGDRFHLIPAEDSPHDIPPPHFDRNVRAFGADIQSALGGLKVGIIGCGGTGSAIAEQLVRLGVRDFVLMEPKALSDTNVTRVYGSAQADVGRDKVQLTKENILRVAPTAQCDAYKVEFKTASAVRAMAGCDIVFGCTDDEGGRLVLSRFSSYLLCPVIDCGVLISSGPDGLLEGIDGRVTVLAPGAACLLCRKRIDVALAAAQLLPEAERQERQAEGYAPALHGVEPAVVTFTTSVAAAAVNELLERMIGFGPTQRPSEMLLRFHDREISTNRKAPGERHYCHPEAGLWGSGIGSPVLGMGLSE